MNSNVNSTAVILWSASLLRQTVYELKQVFCCLFYTILQNFHEVNDY